jgi:cytoskeletal protein CcmA (bactofilin family)
MGLFGRDDRTDGSKHSPVESHTRQKHTPASGSTVTIIAKTSHVEGEIKGAGEVRIEGTVKGKLDCSSSVLVAQGGYVDGELRAETIIVSGKVKGDALASQKIELTPTAEVKGNITAPRILISEGATFEGQVFMTGKKSGEVPEPAKKEEKDPKPDKN